MNLVGYTATALSRNDIEDTPTNKNVVDFAIVELKDLQGNLVVMYDDAEGANPETQKVCDTNGQVTFFAEIGDYDLEINGKAQRINLAANIADYIRLGTGESVQGFADSFALKIFQSPTCGGLTEIQTRTVDAGEVYRVRKTSDDSLAAIYSDAAGTTEIAQDGTDNKSGSDGVVEFYIDDGSYYITVGIMSSDFSTSLKTEFETVSEAVNYKGIRSLLSKIVYIKERDANFEVVLSSTVTPINTYSNVISTANADYAYKIDIKNIMSAKALGAKSDGSDMSGLFKFAADNNIRLDLTNLGVCSWLSTVNLEGDLKLLSFDDFSGITGFDGTGFITSSNVLVEGVTINNFGDLTESNETNYSSTFCRVSSGASLEFIKLKNVKSDKCRSLVNAGDLSNDFLPDTTISTELLSVIDCVITNSPIPVNWRGLCERDVCKGNIYKNIIGAGRIVSAHKCFIDGLGFDDSDYQNCKNHEFSGNYCDTIVNRTITGDSSSGNNYECHAAMLSGVNSLIHSNVVIDCTGNLYDTEAFYTKCEKDIAHSNLLIDAGTNESAINVKGINRDSPITQTGSFGEKSKVYDNIIVFTRESYNNGGTIVDLSDSLIGINVTASNLIDVYENIIVGSNNGDVVVNGSEDSENIGASVFDNKSYLNNGVHAFVWRGAFRSPKSSGNEVINPVLDASKNRFYHTRFISVAARGIDHRSTDFKYNKLIADVSDGRFNGKVISLVNFDGENYDFNGIDSESNTWDVEYGAATPDLRPYYFNNQSGSPAGVFDKIKIRNDNFLQPLTSSPIFFAGTNYESYDIEIEVLNNVFNGNVTAFQCPTVLNRNLTLEFKTSFSTSNNNELCTRWRIANYYNNTGAATNVNASDIYSFKNAPTGEAIHSQSGLFARVNILEGGTDTINCKTKVKAECV